MGVDVWQTKACFVGGPACGIGRVIPGYPLTYLIQTYEYESPQAFHAGEPAIFTTHLYRRTGFSFEMGGFVYTFQRIVERWRGMRTHI